MSRSMGESPGSRNRFVLLAVVFGLAAAPLVAGEGVLERADPAGTDTFRGVDSDGDGVPDAIDNCPAIANPDQVESDPPGAFGQDRTVGFLGWPLSAFAADLDGDDDLDVLGGSWADGTMAWWENTDGDGTFGPRQIIDDIGSSAYSVYAADLDGDDDLDVLCAAWGQYTLSWYENLDGHGTFAPRNVVENGRADAVVAADLDGDGDPDMLGAGGTAKWLENLDGRGTFGPLQTIGLGDQAVAGDVDGDGDLDVVILLHSSLSWSENTDGQGTFGAPQVFADGIYSDCSLSVADLDGDDDLDVVSGRRGSLGWYENTDGNGAFAPERLISSISSSYRVHTADVDGDGDVDVLSASHDRIAWHENLDGNATFDNPRTISSDVELGSAVHAGDVDGDGDLDALFASFRDGRIEWSESDTDGFGDACDNCPTRINENQIDSDEDGFGDACDDCTDPDEDGFGNPGFPIATCADDNCPTAPNPDQADMDLDGFGLACDCSDSDAATFPGALEINDGLDNQCPGDSDFGTVDELSGIAGFLDPDDPTEFSWPAQAGATKYQVARAESADFAAGCAGFPVIEPRFVDPGVPTTGSVFYYLARAFAPNRGSWGQDSSGVERSFDCP